jgi:single-stranded DNA-binding protein
MYNKYICVGNLTRDPETRPVNDRFKHGARLAKTAQSTSLKANAY